MLQELFLAPAAHEIPEGVHIPGLADRSRELMAVVHRAFGFPGARAKNRRSIVAVGRRGSGKTTVLRDIAHYAAALNLAVARESGVIWVTDDLLWQEGTPLLNLQQLLKLARLFVRRWPGLRSVLVFDDVDVVLGDSRAFDLRPGDLVYHLLAEIRSPETEAPLLLFSGDGRSPRLNLLREKAFVVELADLDRHSATCLLAELLAEELPPKDAWWICGKTIDTLFESVTVEHLTLVGGRVFVANNALVKHSIDRRLVFAVAEQARAVGRRIRRKRRRSVSLYVALAAVRSVVQSL